MTDKQKKVTVDDEEEFMKQARAEFKEAEVGMEDIIKLALNDLEMVDGENQWDPDVKKFRTDHGLIVLTENLLPSFLDQVEGDFRQNKPQIDCKPVDGKADPATARILAGMIRNIDVQSQSEMIYNEAFLSMLASSFGAWRIHTAYEDPMSFNKEIVVQPIENSMMVRWDMTCKRFDTSDKKWVQIGQEISKKKFEERWPKAQIASVKQASGTEYDGWFMESHYRIAERWYIDEKDVDIVLLDDGSVCKKSELPGLLAKFRLHMKGIRPPSVVDERTTQIPIVYSSIISGMEILEGPFEWPGKYIPVPIAFGKRLNLNGKTRLKSLIRDAIESQRMHNYLISSMVQGVAMQQKAPYIGTVEQFAGKKEEWQAGLDGDVPFLTYNKDPSAPGAPQRQSPPMPSQGYGELLDRNAKTRMDIIGIHEAGLGMRSNEQSGVAINARQKEGDVGTFVFIDNFRHALTFDGRIKVDLIPKIYDTPRMQRILGNDNKDEFVQLYEQTIDAQGRPVLKANLKVGKYDVVVTTGPTFTSQREQTKEAMVALVQATGPQSPTTQVMMPAVIKLFDLPDGDKMAQAITAMLPEPIQQILSQSAEDGDQMDPKMMAMQQAMAGQVQQMQQQMQDAMAQAQQEMQKLQAENQQLKSGMQAKMADVEAKKELGTQEIAIQREKIMAEMTMKEKELEQKSKLVMQELQAKMATELTMFHEKMKMEREMRTEENKTKATEATKAEGEKKAASESESKQSSQKPVIVNVGGATGGISSKKTITLVGPSGKKYTGEVVETPEDENAEQE